MDFLQIYSTDPVPPSDEVERYAKEVSSSNAKARKERIWLAVLVTLVSALSLALGAFCATLVVLGAVR